MAQVNLSESNKTNQYEMTWERTYQECIVDIEKIQIGWVGDSYQNILCTCMNCQMTNLIEGKIRLDY